MGTKLQLSASPDSRDKEIFFHYPLTVWQQLTADLALEKKLLWSGLGQTKRRVWNCLRVDSSNGMERNGEGPEAAGSPLTLAKEMIMRLPV